MIIYYIGNSVVSDGSHPESGYTLIIFESEVKINYRYSNTNRGTLDTYIPVDGIDGWMHFDITRDEAGHIQVDLNGTNILDATDSYLTVSEKMNFQVEPGTLLDNISYSSSIDQPTEETTTTTATTTTKSSPSWTPLIVLMSLTALLIFKKRMKHS